MPVAEFAVAEGDCWVLLFCGFSSVIGSLRFADEGRGCDFAEAIDDAVLGDSFWAGLCSHTEYSKVPAEGFIETLLLLTQNAQEFLSGNKFA